MDGVTAITMVSVALPVVFFIVGGMHRVQEWREKNEQDNGCQLSDEWEQGIVEGSVIYIEEEEEAYE